MTFKEFMDDYFDHMWNEDKTPNGDYRDQQTHDMYSAYRAGAYAESGFLEGWICPMCHVAHPPWVTECKCSKDTDYYTTTQNVLTRVTNKGPLPPPVVDFSTDHCATCGEVLNQCTCEQVLQRVDFNEELEAENKQLKAQLEKMKCCENCKYCYYDTWSVIMNCALSNDGSRICGPKLNRWEMQE